MAALLRDRGWIFFAANNEVYRAPESAPESVDGYPMGGRWFCPMWQWTERQQTGIYPFEQQWLAV